MEDDWGAVEEETADATEEEPEDFSVSDSSAETSDDAFEEGSGGSDEGTEDDWETQEENPADALEEELEEDMFDMDNEYSEVEEEVEEDNPDEEAAPPSSTDEESPGEQADTPPPPDAPPPSEDIDFDDLMDEFD